MDLNSLRPYPFQDSNNLVNQILITIVNNHLKDNVAIAAKVAKPHILIDYILDILREKGFIEINKTFDGMVRIAGITIQGRRVARELGN